MFIRFWRSLSWIILILILSFIPGDKFGEPKLFNHFDLFVHAFLYAVLALINEYDINKNYRNNFYFRSTMPIILIVGTIIGIATEIVQYYLIPNRNGSIYDLIADIIGAFLGITLFRLFLLKK